MAYLVCHIQVAQQLLLICSLQMGEPGKVVGVDEIVSGLEKLGESPEVTIPLKQYLRPALATLPMCVWSWAKKPTVSSIQCL